MFVAEGRREVSLALRGGIEAEYVLVCQELYRASSDYPVDLGAKSISSTISVSPKVYNKLAYRQDREGIMLVGKVRAIGLNDLPILQDPLFLVLERVEKPGNLGAIIRTADAAGVDAILLPELATDMYNPNVIRSSLGCVFSLPVISCDSTEALLWLRERGVSIYAAALQTQSLYYGVDMRGATALVFGSEDQGLGELWRKEADQIIKIPMTGSIDSLNVAASVAVLTFEAVRQRSLQCVRHETP